MSDPREWKKGTVMTFGRTVRVREEMSDIDWSVVRCRFHPRCLSPVVGLYAMPHGCVCWSDPVQALCAQHIISAESAGPITPIVERGGDDGERS